MSTKKPLRVGLIGYGFMGRTHSNAFRQVGNFFDLEYQPVLQAVCARDAAKAKDFADRWGWRSIETDWRKLVDGVTLTDADAFRYTRLVVALLRQRKFGR